MQVVVLRALRNVVVIPKPSPPDKPGPSANAICCTEVGRSAVFTPAPNAISNVAVNLPVKADIVPSGPVFEFDLLALSVLAPGVPLPVHDTGNYQNIAGPTAAIFFPAIQPGQDRADSFGTLGYQLLMQADWVPVLTGPPGGPGAPNPTTGAAVTLVQPVATVQRNLLLLSLRCNQNTPCVGVLTIQNPGVVVGIAGALATPPTEHGGSVRTTSTKLRGPTTVAKAKFNIAPGQIQAVGAKMTRRGKRLVRKPTPPALIANVNIGAGMVSAGSVQLTR